MSKRVEEAEVRPFDPGEILAVKEREYHRSRVVAVLGYPGAGKTVFLAALTYYFDTNYDTGISYQITYGQDYLMETRDRLLKDEVPRGKNLPDIPFTAAGRNFPIGVKLWRKEKKFIGERTVEVNLTLNDAGGETFEAMTNYVNRKQLGKFYAHVTEKGEELRIDDSEAVRQYLNPFVAKVTNCFTVSGGDCVRGGAEEPLGPHTQLLYADRYLVFIDASNPELFHPEKGTSSMRQSQLLDLVFLSWAAQQAVLRGRRRFPKVPISIVFTKTDLLERDEALSRLSGLELMNRLGGTFRNVAHRYFQYREDDVLKMYVRRDGDVLAAPFPQINRLVNQLLE
ncbi:hypothetical protein HS1genome_1936 [Sulfodiicoccus acidiphilus]|uniref:Uncharacterized protein n=1 Tax=Sulfodiicoccus acidiphilus TaxID=1670455 RepID=A0A348B5U5_9CREN|nr:hypothetical protein [Sulfodiicoccus acidiphilus]BBD73547.1 hypothetical protein HS1genome_1936 [Sulfodiicoccus acidiphilus]GGT92370.1 hypothetical protein GCM10007116_07620 [Sulfodiicoccus acidiphilus]